MAGSAAAPRLSPDPPTPAAAERAAARRPRHRSYYICYNRSRYDTSKCDGYRIDADSADTAVLGSLATFYRANHTLIAAIDNAPTLPAPDTLTDIADHITTGTDQTRKALIDTLVAEIKITGPDTIVPIFRIPQPAPATPPPLSTPPQPTQTPPGP